MRGLLDIFVVGSMSFMTSLLAELIDFYVIEIPIFTDSVTVKLRDILEYQNRFNSYLLPT